MSVPADQPSLTLDGLEARINDGSIDTVISAITDLQGRLMGKRVTGDFFLDHARDGTHFCTYLLGTDMEMRTPAGYRLMSWETGYGDFLAAPDWSTLRVIPWLEKTALVLADVRDEASGELVPVAPRTVLRRQVERAREMGFDAMMASELEFYLLRDSYESAQKKQFHDLEPFGWYNEDYHLLQATKAEPLYRRFRNQMCAAGIPVEFSKGEAAPGQHEVNIHFDTALTSADRHVLFKHGLKEMAWQHGNAVTFMAKPDHTWTGNSAHVHVSLRDAGSGDSLFHDPGATQYGMSETMRHFLGGLMRGIRELAFFIAPFVNSYKRFAAGSWAPTNLVWGHDNRTCAFRIVGDGAALRIETRLPGGDANAYLAYAAIIGAGLHGIANRIEPPAEQRGNGYEAVGVPRVPRALWEAAQLLDESGLAREIFGDEVVAHYVNTARVEQEAYDSVVTCWERQRYLERG
ncbi:MAG TPA: glutamine synthetase family protein [Gemmatimonadaceae bacterium]|nr:glutamine synthetase family protein [Gemmatimonadaceae bacterium]